MKKYLVGFIYSLPIQLVILHIRRNQVLLIFWYVLFATVSGNFLQTFGANSLYLAPEYLGKVNALSTAIVGFSIAVFMMSWNITTFILHGKHITFLATTAQPFLKFCINNAVIPLIFLVFYFCYAIPYEKNLELLGAAEILMLAVGFLSGFTLAVVIAFFYFFRADKKIYRGMQAVMIAANKSHSRAVKRKPFQYHLGEIRVEWFLSASLALRKPRNVKHYSEEFLDSIFKRHHIAGVIAIFFAFIFLIAIGYFFDNKIFQVPAAASVTVFFAILIAVAGAVSLFFKSWSIPFVAGLYLLINWMYQLDIIDLSNKAYGLNYGNEKDRPAYSQENISKLASSENIEKDKNNFIQILNAWKHKQAEEKPILFLINVSGGGNRSATFTLNVLQKLDSISNGGLMRHTILINGASGGMLGAAYFRALYWEKEKGIQINLQDNKYSEDISKDLLNPLFSSFVSRDLIGPIKKFETNGYTYIRDRAYAFEQKLDENTRGLLGKKLSDYKMAEQNADIPLMFFNSTITRDGRKMIISTQPVRFLMKSTQDSINNINNNPDALDFVSFFEKQNPMNLRLLSALRMNASFPYVLPNVWLPTRPVIDVMDAGLRDNYGQESSLRFVEVFKDWLKENTSKVVLIQIRDRVTGDWDNFSEPESFLNSITKPILLLQNNLFKLQDYYQMGAFQYLQDYYGPNLFNVFFQYVPGKAEAPASLSFHLTASEKKDIATALNNPANQKSFDAITLLIK